MALSKQQKIDLWDDFEKKTQSGELEYISPQNSQEYRKKFWLQQDCKCPVLKDTIRFEDSSLDHQHKLQSEKLGENGKGLVRAVLHREINALEGKVINYWNRCSIKFKYKLQAILRNLADYYDNIEQGNLPIEQKYIYPTEKPQQVKEILTKQQYNKIKKYYFKVYPRRTKLPKYTKNMSKWHKEILSDIDDYLKKKGK